MSQYYDQASLVVVPSGYKAGTVYAQKPLTTDGQLAFTRTGDTATRVNSAGLIEKVRTNLILQSQDFTTTWGKASLTISANTTANPLNGAVDADTFILTGATTQKFIAQAFTLNGTYTASAYLKAGTHQFVQFMLGTDASVFANFNISAGSVGTSAGCTASITSVGNGWYRCIMTFSSTTGDNVFILAADSASAARFSTTSSTGTFIAFGYQLELSDFGATAYIPTTTAAVSVGPVANVPRLDNLGSTCPRLLLEPTATALNQFSEQLDNAYWAKTNCSVTANQTASPSGYVDAELILDNTSNSQHAISTTISVTSGNKYTASFFLKEAGYTTAAIRMGVGSLWTGGGGPTVEFDLTALTGTIVEGSGVTFAIEDYGNGWRRCSVTGTCVTSGGTAYSLYVKQYAGYIGNGTSGIYAWGANLTATGYIQSYIPTLAASATRGADSLSLLTLPNSNMTFSAVLTMASNPIATTSGDWLYISAANLLGRAYGYFNGFGFADAYALDATAGRKIAWKQESGTTAKIFSNGSLLGTSTTGTYSSPYVQFVISAAFLAAPLRIESFLFFDAALSDSDLQTLTTL